MPFLGFFLLTNCLLQIPRQATLEEIHKGQYHKLIKLMQGEQELVDCYV